MAHFNENKTMNFSYLENLISSGAREINLDFDIVLDDFEAARYQHGIEIKRDKLIINGNGHVIDARNRTGIFLNQGQNIVFKNINFINGFSRDGWSVLVNFHGSMEISDCKFKNNVAELGTLVNMGQMKIQNCIIEDNRSRYAGGINNQEGSLEISASKFIGNNVPGNSGAVDVEGGSVDIMDCEFIKNESGRIGGAIFSIGKVRCRNTKFISNQAEFDGGAINNQPGAILELLNTEFINNKSDRNGGGISNAGKLTVKDSLFKDNYAGTDGGAINSQPDELINNNEEMIMPTGNNGDLNNDSKEDIYKSYAEISNSRFLNNKAKDIGGSLTNWSKASIKDSLFESNEANYGGAVNNQPGARLELEDTLFEKNIASKIGAAVCNYGQMEALKNIFKNNNANGDGGAINNQPGARMNIDDCEFSKNSSKDAGGAIYNWEDLRINNGTFDENTSLEGLSIVNRKKTSISNSKFTNHTGNDIIINNNDLNIRDSIFEKNNSQSIIKNQEDGILSINYGSFNDNDNLKSTIYNIGKSCSIAESIFENNKSKEGYADIYNESELKLKSPQFKNTEDNKQLNNEKDRINNLLCQ